MYVVIGAGLAGMAAALTLQKNGVEVTVVESSDRAGGRVATDYIDGFTLDRGFQLINANYSEIKRWNLLQEMDFKVAPRTVGVALASGNIRLGDPRSTFLSIFSKKSGSIYAKASFLRYLTSAPKINESVQDHLLRTGVEDLYLKVLKPFLSGVFLADPAKVSAVIGREIIGSFINARSGIPAKGVGDLASKMAERIRDLRLNTQVEEIANGGVETSQGFITAERIILATDLTTAGQLLDAKEVGRLTGSTTWYHSTTQAPTENAEIIVDSENRGPVVNSIVISNLSKAYAPAGQHLISSTTITHSSESEVRRQLAQMWGKSTGDWRFLAKYEINSALPLFQPGYVNTSPVSLIKNIYCAGDYLESPSQNGALLSGRKAAEQLLIDQRS
jgi:phytoene dehydrogenase-like protein